MRRTVRRSGGIALLAALVAVPTGLPAAAQSSSPTQITQRHSVLTELGADGEVSTSRVFTQLTVAGNGPTTVTLPNQPTRGLRSLDGFRGPEVAGEDVVWNVSATPAGTRGRTVAENTSDLPVDVAVRYTLDGREVEPTELVGRSGRLAVTYTVTNTTAEPVEIHPTDARGNRQTESIDVAVPMVGSLALTLPPNFTAVDARGANIAGDGRGNTVVNFSLLLFAPLGDEVQEVTYVANVTDAVVPGATIQVLPVDESSFTSLRSTSLAYRDATDGTQRLGYGAQLIDTNVLKLADGAAQLLDGLTQLSDGADQLSAGLSDTAAPGARQLADGTGTARSGAGQLATGLGELSLGANRLRDGLGQANLGAGALAGGLSDLSAGSVRLRDGLGSAAAGSSTLAGGLNSLAAGSAAIESGAGDLAAGVNQIAGGAGGLPAAAEGLGTIADGLDGVEGGIDRLIAAVTDIRAAVGTVPGCDTTDPDSDCGVLDGLNALEAGIQQVQGGIAASIQPLLDTPGCDPLTGDDPATCGAAQLATAAQGASSSVSSGLGAAITGLEGLRDAYAGDPIVVGTLDTVLGGLGTARSGATSAAGLAGGAQQKAAGASGALSPAGPIGGGLLQVLGGIDALQDGISRTDPGDPAAEGFEPGLLQALGLVRGGLTSPDCVLSAPTDPTNPCGLKQVVGKLLGPGADTLAADLAPALLQLAGAFGTLDAPGVLTAGANALAAGAGELRTGAGAAASGAGDLRSGLGQLSAGSRDLAAGAGAAASGAGDLGGGLNQLADGSRDLAAGAGRAAGGGRDLASGLGQIDDGASALADGLGDAADGSTQLAEGLTAAEDGGTQIADGSVALSEQGMSALIDGISDAKLGASRNLETIKAVSERGRGFDGPFGTAARADASTVWQFEVAGVGDAGGAPSTTTVALLALLALGVAGGAGTLVRRRMV